MRTEPEEKCRETRLVPVHRPSTPSLEQRKNSLISSFQQRFHASPFPLTAEKLEIIVRAIDWEGPQLLGFFYLVELRKECGILIPYPILHFEHVSQSGHKFRLQFILRKSFFHLTNQQIHANLYFTAGLLFIFKIVIFLKIIARCTLSRTASHHKKWNITNFADIGFLRMLATWICNPRFFQCRTIGIVLECYRYLQTNEEK